MRIVLHSIVRRSTFEQKTLPRLGNSYHIGTTRTICRIRRGRCVVVLLHRIPLKNHLVTNKLKVVVLRDSPGNVRTLVSQINAFPFISRTRASFPLAFKRHSTLEKLLPSKVESLSWNVLFKSVPVTRFPAEATNSNSASFMESEGNKICMRAMFREFS